MTTYSPGLNNGDVAVQVKNATETIINPSTEEKQDAIIAALGGGAYATRIDESTAVVTYVGKAATGSATSSSVWQLQKLDSTSGLAITWADGDALFNNAWDNRASLTYN